MNKNIRTFKALNICILVISDTRNKTSDKSGRVLEKKIKESGHIIFDKIFIKDEPKKIESHLKKIIDDKKCNVIILSGGTGLTGRDSTPEAVKKVLTKEIPGFGEIFRYISYKKIGTSSLQSRSLGGLAKDTFVFALPGSPNACIDAWDEILKFQLDSRTKPCNLVDLMPRFNE